MGQPKWEIPNDPEPSHWGFTDKITADRGIEVLRAVADDPEHPFYVAIGFSLPHEPWHFPKDPYWNGKVPTTSSMPRCF